MNREIKYRGKRTDNSEWVYGYVIVQPMSIGVMMPYIFDGEYEYRVERGSVAQYTGLMDKNGVEIYEGDIVQEHHGGLAFQPDFFQLKTVQWDTFGYMPFTRVIGGAAHDYAINLKEYIVAGNICENPELLEATT